MNVLHVLLPPTRHWFQARLTASKSSHGAHEMEVCPRGLWGEGRHRVKKISKLWVDPPDCWWSWPELFKVTRKFYILLKCLQIGSSERCREIKYSYVFVCNCVVASQVDSELIQGNVGEIARRFGFSWTIWRMTSASTKPHGRIGRNTLWLTHA